MTELVCLTGEFAQLLTPAESNDTKLTDWITTVRAVELTHLHSFANGLELDRAAANAGLTRPYHNGRTEGANTRTKRIMRQTHGRAGFPLLRHRILTPVITTRRYHRLRARAVRLTDPSILHDGPPAESVGRFAFCGWWWACRRPECRVGWAPGSTAAGWILFS